MSLTFESQVIPLHKDDGGAIRVGQTRVTLESVIYSFEEGASPETIVDQFPTLQLEDVYLVIGYYLSHRAEVAGYLEEGRQLADKHRQEVEARSPSVGIRERLLARQRAGQV